MADSIFSQAGFDLPTSQPSASAPVSAPSSIFESAGFALPGKEEKKKEPTWQEREADENLAALGIKAPAEPPKPPGQGRGVVQALKDYPGVLANRLIDTLKYPGDVMQGNKPVTIEDTLGLAGLAYGGGIGRTAGTAVATKMMPSTRAVNSLVEAIGPENVPELVAGMRANPRMTPADLSDPVRVTTQGLMAGGTPDVQSLISKTVRDRAGSRLEAANTAYTEAMGPAPDVPKMVEGLKEKARAAGREAIQPALESAKPVDVTPVISAIDEKLKPGVTAMMGETKLPLSPIEQELVRLKSRLTDGENQIFDAKKLHEIQSDVGDQAYQLSKSPDPKDRRMGSQLRDINEKLISQIDASTEGAYRPAREKFKDAKDISEAFEAGFDTLKNRSGLSGAMEDSPQAFREWMKTASPEEVVARRLGTRADIDQKINGVKNGALAGQNITQIPYNKEKLTALFGPKEAGRLIRVMEDAHREAQTNAAILSGSKTAETEGAKARIKVREVGGGNPLQYVAPVAAELLGQSAGVPFVGLGGSLLAKGAHMSVQKLGQMSDIARNMEFARNALAAGPAREETIRSLLSHPKVVREFKKRHNALAAP